MPHQTANLQNGWKVIIFLFFVILNVSLTCMTIVTVYILALVLLTRDVRKRSLMKADWWPGLHLHYFPLSWFNPFLP